MKTDKPIYKLFSSLPHLMAAFVELEAETDYEFESITLKETERHCDGVLIPKDGRGVTYLVEFQMQLEPTIYARACAQRGLYKIQKKPEYIRNLIIFLNEQCDPNTPDFRWMKGCCTKDFRVLYLDKVVEKLRICHPKHPLVFVFGPFLEPTTEKVERDWALWYRQLKQTPLAKENVDTLIELFMNFLFQRLPNLSLEDLKMVDLGIDYNELSHTTIAKHFVEVGEARGEARGETVMKQRILPDVERLFSQGLIPEEAYRQLKDKLKS